MNPSRLLVEHALQLWALRKKRADNTTVVTVMLDPPGPPKSEVLLRRRMLLKLRPREEPEAGPSSERDWWDPRSRVMVNHEPSPQVAADDCVTRPIWSPEYPTLNSSFTRLPTPPPLPPKTKHFGRQHSTSSGSGSTLDKWMRQDAGSTLSSSYAGEPVSRSSLPPPRNVAAADLNQELLRSAPTPPLPFNGEDVPVPHCCKPPTTVCSKPASLQRICRFGWDRGHTTTDFSKCVTFTKQDDDRMVPTTLKDRHSLTMAKESLLSNNDDIKLQYAAPFQSGGDANVEKVHSMVYSKEESQFSVSCKADTLDDGETVTGLKRKSPPGRRELIRPITKHPRVSHSKNNPWSVCRPEDCVSEHVTRSRIRLRKAQA